MSQQQNTEDILRMIFKAALENPEKSGAAIPFQAVSGAAAERIRQAMGIDTAGYMHAIGNGEILKILKDHGKEGEGLRGQIPVTLEIFLKISVVLADPDLIENAGKTKQGLDAIRLIKRINGIIITIEEVRTGRKQLVPKTLYVRKAGAKHAPEG